MNPISSSESVVSAGGGPVSQKRACQTARFENLRPLDWRGEEDLVSQKRACPLEG
jgi:hypothetical protein